MIFEPVLAKTRQEVHPRHHAVTQMRGGPLDESKDLISIRPWNNDASVAHDASRRFQPAGRVAFDRKELQTILGFYGVKVAEGEWRDYAMDFGPERAVFSVFRRSSEVPLYRIVKDPSLARKQGMYQVIAQGGLILKRGHDLPTVLRVLLKTPRLSPV